MKGVLFSVFDPAFPRSSVLYSKLAAAVSPHAPHVVFPGNPLPDLPYPAWSSVTNRERLLRDLWKQLGSFLQHKVVPAVRQESMVVLDGCCLNVFLVAATMAENHDEIARLEKLHRLIERNEFSRLRLPTPRYILQRGTDVEREIAHIRWANTVTIAIEKDRLQKCVTRVQSLVRSYFKSETGRYEPHRILLAERTSGELAEISSRYLKVPLPIPAEI